MLAKFDTMSGWVLFMRSANLARITPSYTSITFSVGTYGSE
jgi:hypothetical protein